MRVMSTQWEEDTPTGKEAMWILAGQVHAAVRKFSLENVDFFCSHACAFPSFVFSEELLVSRFFTLSFLFLWTHYVKWLIFQVFVLK